ncbi:MAG: MBL fold metallo-hydrolase [Burkholderiaceae bacterium]|nr:MBL fold metallo-hydrolase [Burkholderiaceae bacterium]
MNPLEQQLQYPVGDAMPEPGNSMELAPGVRWLRMPLPFALDHINLWLLRDRIDGREGWTIVDCGISRDEVKVLWEQIFKSQLEGLPVLRVVVTHMHPDHIGLAHWLCERWNCAMHISMTDYMASRLWSTLNNGGASGGESAVRHFASHGLTDPGDQEKIRGRSSYYGDLVPSVPGSFVRVMNGSRLEIGGHLWEAIAGYGHAPEHMSFFCAELGVLISGDMVLPRISTNISVFDFEPMANPLPLYLNSLDAFKHLPADTLVLPSHGRPFRGLHERIGQQHDHHADRLAEVLEACATPHCAADIVPILFKRKLDLHQMTFALGESLAHLHALYYEGKLSRRICDDGIIRFTRT